MITLLGEPRSTNNIYRSVCRGKFASTYMTNEGKALKEDYQWQARAQWGNSMPMKGPISLSARFFFKTHRKVDLDNFNKLLLDSMSEIVYDDDSQINELTLKRDYDKKNPRIEVEIQEI